MVGLITDNDETAYREEVRDLAVWYQENNLSLNVSKTKELIVDYRKRRAEQATLTSKGLKWSRSRVSSSLVSRPPQVWFILGNNFQTPERTTFICTNNSTQV